jgi:hypothetical protein
MLAALALVAAAVGPMPIAAAPRPSSPAGVAPAAATATAGPAETRTATPSRQTRVQAKVAAAAPQVARLRHDVPLLQLPRSAPDPASARGAGLPAVRPLGSNGAAGLAPGPAIAYVPTSASNPSWDGIESNHTISPPDPWVAVGPAHVVQVTNQAVRVTNRTGVQLLEMPLASLFGLPAAERASNPRMLYDALHSRWIASVQSYTDSMSEAYLNLAVSDTSDPTGTWSVITWSTTVWVTDSDHLVLNDFPSIGTSSDKIVMSANLFDINGPVPSYVMRGAAIWVVPWAPLLADGDASATFSRWDTIWTIRPANNLTASTTVNLIATDDADNIVHASVTGSAAAPTISSFASLGLFPAWDPVAPANVQPRQPGAPATISRAVMHGVIDAVVRNGQLWFISTFPVSYDGYATWNLAVRADHFDVTDPSPTHKHEYLFQDNTIDQYMPGVGISGDNTVYFVWTRSSASEYVSTRAKVWTSTGGLSGETVIDRSSATYTSSSGRWGGYVGVAADPLAPWAVWQNSEAVGAGGDWRTTVSRLVFELVAPTVSAPTQELVANSTLTPLLVPVRVRWTAADSGSGVQGVEIDRCTAAACASTVHAGLSATRTLTLLHYWLTTPAAVGDLAARYQYQATALDVFGNASAPALGLALAPVVTQQTASVVYAGTWSNASGSGYSGGSAKTSTKVGASATFTFAGRSVGFVSYRAATRGKVKVYLDGVLKGTINLKSTSIQSRRLVFTANTSTGTHKLKLVVVSGKVDVDAFVVLK